MESVLSLLGSERADLPPRIAGPHTDSVSKEVQFKRQNSARQCVRVGSASLDVVRLEIHTITDRAAQLFSS